jgi:hypothetical protein
MTARSQAKCQLEQERTKFRAKLRRRAIREVGRFVHPWDVTPVFEIVGRGVVRLRKDSP